MKYNEEEYLKEILDYIRSTYKQHYSNSKSGGQVFDDIIEDGHAVGFFIGNIRKYARRYGRKNGYNRLDLLKMIHLAIILLHVQDGEKENLEEEYVAPGVSATQWDVDHYYPKEYRGYPLNQPSVSVDVKGKPNEVMVNPLIWSYTPANQTFSGGLTGGNVEFKYGVDHEWRMQDIKNLTKENE